MAYSIKVRTFQKRTDEYFRIIEKGVYNDGTWTSADGVETLKMANSGHGGMLRLMTENGTEAFFLALGVHNYKPWLDVITGLGDEITTVRALPEYWTSGTPRDKTKWQTPTSVSILNIDSRTISANYKVSEGNDLEINLVIG